MSFFWVMDDAGHRRMVEVPPELKGAPARVIFAWLEKQLGKGKVRHGEA